MNKFRKTFDHKFWLYDFIKFTSWFCSAIYFRTKRVYVAGKKPKGIFKGKLIICSNHMSYEDVPAIISGIWERRISFLAAKEAFNKKSLGRLLKNVQCIKIDRETIDIEAIKKAIEMIDRGHAICIFPEGKINTEHQLMPFKSGIVMTAYLAGADILPIYTSRAGNRASRQIMIIGDRINFKSLFKEKNLNIDQINKITNILNTKINELKTIFDKNFYQEEKAKAWREKTKLKLLKTGNARAKDIK